MNVGSAASFAPRRPPHPSIDLHTQTKYGNTPDHFAVILVQDPLLCIQRMFPEARFLLGERQIDEPITRHDFTLHTLHTRTRVYLGFDIALECEIQCVHIVSTHSDKLHLITRSGDDHARRLRDVNLEVHCASVLCASECGQHLLPNAFGE